MEQKNLPKKEVISVIDAAKELGMRKQTLFKKLKKLKIQSFKERSENHKGQVISYILREDLKQVKDFELASPNKEVESLETIIGEGFFYLIQLEPEFDKGRFKVGFAKNVNERLRDHRCSAPFARLIKKWRCKSLWEKTAIDCVAQGCERLHTEVFRTDNLKMIIDRCDSFFQLMPERKSKNSN